MKCGIFWGVLLSVGLASAAEPGIKQSSVKGLLVTQLEKGDLAGTASQMNATVVKKDGSFEIGFNQDVGDMMNKATDEVRKFIAVRHDGKLPDGYRLELAFADKYSPKDGPSAAVACALLADSIITGESLDTNFAVTGDMAADGKVQPVGGVSAKLRGARKAHCRIVAVPISNQDAVSDTYIIEGLKPLYQMQIFSVTSFEEAHAIALKNRTPEIQAALNEFQAVQDALGRNEAFVFNPKLQEKLKGVMKTLPNHLSAKLLLAHGQKQAPNRLSLAGSMNAIDQADQELGAMLMDRSWLESSGDEDVLYRFIADMDRLRDKLDKRTIDYGDSYRGLATYVRSIRGRKQFTPQMQDELNAAAKRVKARRSAVLADPKIREELMIE